jgi:hypothetical protein
MPADVRVAWSHHELRRFLARLLGWANKRAVDLALLSVGLAVDHYAALVLYGVEDLVPIAWSLHRRTLGPDRPFIVCDPRRGNVPESVRAPASYRSGVQAVAAAAGGALCMRTRRLPDDFAAAARRLYDSDVMLIACDGALCPDDLLHIRPAPIRVPPLARRVDELSRIIDEYARDAMAELAAAGTSFTAADHAWVRQYAATSLAEIEKATLRLVALRASKNPSIAAARLGMAPVSLHRWLARRQPPEACDVSSRKHCGMSSRKAVPAQD